MKAECDKQAASTLSIPASVMVVDDSPDNLRIMQEVLSIDGYNIRSSISGSLALKSARANPPDIVLLDIFMPEMDGYEVCKQLREDTQTKDIPILFISASDDPQIKATAFESGGQDYITKPFQTQEILARVRTQLALYYARQNAEKKNRELSAAHDQLEQSLNELKATHQHLIESETMAMLGKLVAGVAHEINTPLGVLVTATSYFADITQALQANESSQSISQEKLEKYFNDAGKIAKIILSNTARAAELVQNFKQVAIDQTNEVPREINLATYLHTVVESLLPELKAGRHQVSIECPSDISFQTFPGAVAQILTNLIVNSVKHGFGTEISEGKIFIRASLPDDMVKIDYRDSGKGMSSVALKHAFEPFYTTARSQGGSGLGLFITYNIVTQKLKGNITLNSSPQDGMRAEITFPIDAAT